MRNGLKAPHDQTIDEWLSDYDEKERTMGIKVKDTGGGDFKKVPQGTHLAICNMVVDLGDQLTTYKGQEKIAHKIYVRWEVPAERLEYEVDGQKKEGPLAIGKMYTASLSEKANLRKDLEGWRNKSFTQEELQGFDIENVLGTCCQIIVTHKTTESGTYANVTGVAGWPKGIDRPQAENELIYYDAVQTSYYEKLPNWIKEKLGATPEPKNGNGSIPGPDEDFDDDIPF